VRERLYQRGHETQRRCGDPDDPREDADADLRDAADGAGSCPAGVPGEDNREERERQEADQQAGPVV
jgi:hypothetical protein